MIKTTRFPSLEVPRGVVVGGTHRLLDAWVAAQTVHVAPAFIYPEHAVEFQFEHGEMAPQPAIGIARKLARRLRGSTIIELPESSIGFDCRHDSSGNVAHVLQGQVGVALTGLEAIGLGHRHADLRFIVRSDTPGYAIRLFEVLGFQTIAASDAVVRGERLLMRPNKFPMRAVAAHRLRRHAVELGLLGEDDPPGEPVFLARRSRRTLENLAEIEAIANRRGYRTLYPEDLPVEAQIATIANAHSILGLHGAAMGFMMFRSPMQQGVVIECFPCGYPTGWGRAICHLTNDYWLGALGDLDPGVIARQLGDAHPRDFEGMNYRLDPPAVEALLAMAGVVGSRPKREWALEDLLALVRGIRLGFSRLADGGVERFVVDEPRCSADMRTPPEEPTPAGGSSPVHQGFDQ